MDPTEPPMPEKAGIPVEAVPGAEEHCAWLARALEGQAAAACAELERRHWESLAFLRTELATTHEALVASLGARLTKPLVAPVTALEGGCAPRALPGLPAAAEHPARGAPRGQPGPVSSGLPERPGEAWTEVAPTRSVGLPVPAKPERACALHGVGSDEHSCQLPGEAPQSEADDNTFIEGPSKRRSTPETMCSSSEAAKEDYQQREISERLSEKTRTSEISQREISEKLFRPKSTMSTKPLNSWRDLVDSTHFEILMVICVMLNSVFMALEVQNDGLKLGYDLEYPSYTDPDPWIGASDILDAITFLFGIVFAAEISLKLIVLRWNFFATRWNIFDLVVALVWLSEVLLLPAVGVNPTFLRVARLAWLLRLARFRHIQSFDALFLMYTSLMNSGTVLFWSCGLLFTLQVLSALFLGQILHTVYFGDDRYPQAEQQEVFRYFGSFARAMLSTFQMSLTSSFGMGRILIEHVSEWFILFCIVHQLIVGLAIVGIINGIFIQETFKAASGDDFIMMHARESKMRAHRKKMNNLLAAGDSIPKDGQLDQNEFIQLMCNEDVKMWLASMGLDPSDGAALFTLLDMNKEGVVSQSELTDGVSNLQGPARSLDVHLCMHMQKDIIRLLSSLAKQSESSVPAGLMGRVTSPRGP